MLILDRYLVKQFLQTLLFGLLAFTLIFVVIDMMENLDDFIDKDLPFTLVLQYYLVFTPEIIKLMTPVAVLFGCLFTTGRMVNLNELTSIKASGVSMYRFMTPFFIVTIIICLISIFFGGYVVPQANKSKLHIENHYLHKRLEFNNSNLFFQDAKNRIVNISFYDERNLQAVRVGIQEFNPNDLTRMTYRLDAERIVFDTVKKRWIAFNGSEKEFKGKGEIVAFFREKEIMNLNFLPDDLSFKQQKPQQMNLEELRKLIDERKKSGNDPTRIEIEYHARYSFAMASLVCVLFGLPFSANKRRGGLALQFGINVLLTFLYLGFTQIFQAFGKNGSLNPLLTAWLTNILFLVAASINIFRVKQ